MVSAPTHRVVPSPVGIANNDCVLRNGRARDRGNELGSVFRDTLMLVLLANHEAHDVLEEYEGDATLLAELDKVCRFERAFGEKYAIVRDDPNGIPVDASESTDNC